MDRAYSILSVKAVDEDQMIIEGIATTPQPDRMGDVVDPMGAQFKNPMPLLWQHSSSKPVGTVTFDKPTPKGIGFTAKLARVVEPGVLKDRIDEAWQSVKAGLVRAVSIGFRPIKYAYMDDGGVEFQEIEVLELSLVTIPANAGATISNIKSIDGRVRAATGIKDTPTPRKPDPASGKSHSTTNDRKPNTMARKSIADQIKAFNDQRKLKVDRMTQIMDDAAESGETLDKAADEEYNTLAEEIKSIDSHVARLQAHEALVVARSATVDAEDEDGGSQSRDPAPLPTVQLRAAGPRVSIQTRKVAPGTAFTRYVLALTRSQGNIMMAQQQAMNNDQWKAETPEVAEVLKAAVNAGTTTDPTWAGPLVVYQNMTAEFISYLRPLTIIGRIPGLRNVPFKIKIPRQTGAASVNWVGEGKVKPLTSMAFDTITMEFAKIAGIIPLTEELVRFSSPSAEALVREELANAIIQFMDSQFVDPTKAANDVSPASITNGVTPVTATGTNVAAFQADLRTLMSSFLANNINTAGLVWIMTQQQALALSLMQNALGQPVYPTVTMAGGTLAGLPVVTSENLPATGGSPTDGGMIILAKASDILLADDGQVTIDASREASLQMDSTPDSPATAATVMVSLWQNNMVAIKAERFINWAKARSTSVAYIQNARYA